MLEAVKTKTILLIDDDEEDYLLLRDIFKESQPELQLRWLQDGEQALAHLMARTAGQPAPNLILLDLNMPKLSGREVLGQIRSNAELRHIPVVILSNSMNQKEAADAYQLGANSFIRKPAGYKELKDFVQVLHRYWFVYSTLV